VLTLVPCRPLSHGASTYFEGQVEDIEKARYGYSRDHRPDCQQVVLALFQFAFKMSLTVVELWHGKTTPD
jgi:hypothetical protein